MFIVLLTYTKPIEIVDQYLKAHRDYLEEGYKKNFFIVSGPKNPRTGGIIVSQLSDRAQLEEILKNDPFKLNDVANYEILEFSPTKQHRNFSMLLEK